MATTIVSDVMTARVGLSRAGRTGQVSYSGVMLIGDMLVGGTRGDGERGGKLWAAPLVSIRLDGLGMPSDRVLDAIMQTRYSRRKARISEPEASTLVERIKAVGGEYM